MKKPARGADELTPEAIEARLVELDRKLERLRALYESFFMGVERTPPAVPRREMNRLVLEMQQVPIHNASLRFRFQSLLQRWVLLTTYWNRTLREIEAGTYSRDLAKAHRHLAGKGGVLTEEEALRMGIPANRVKAFVSRQARMAERKGTPVQGTPPPVAPQAAAARPAPVPGLKDGQLEAFFERYVSAHEKATGARPNVTIDQLRAKLTKEIPRILAEKKCTGVDLDVAVEEGKVRLKARPLR